MSKKHAEQILCQSVSSVCNYIFDIRTKGHMFLTQRRKVSQSICVRRFHTEDTEDTESLRSVFVSRRRRRLSQKHAEQILCVSVSSV